MAESNSRPNNYALDYLTVIALSMLAYTLDVLLHEHLGHALACVSLGGHPSELGAYYVTCQYGGMPDLGIRLVALAGPLVSLVTGTLGLLVFGRIPQRFSHLRYGTWLFGTISLMTAAGYLLFSGISGLGDFGTSRDGALYQLQPEWLWRSALALIGAASYALVIYISLRKMDRLIGGEGNPRVAHAQKLALTSYLTGILVAGLIGLLNPHGLVIILISALPSTIGGKSGLAWMMQLLDRKKAATIPPLPLTRSWLWIGTGLLVTILYAVIFGPTLRP